VPPPELVNIAQSALSTAAANYWCERLLNGMALTVLYYWKSFIAKALDKERRLSNNLKIISLSLSGYGGEIQDPLGYR
jgi:hypothetical protein